MARELTFRILNAITRIATYDGNYIRDEITASNLSGPDKRLTWELVNGLLKNKTMLDHVLDRYITRRPQVEVLNVLRLGLYQLLFTRIPHYAVLHETVEIIKKSKFKFSKNFVNGVLRNVQRDLQQIREIIESESLPDPIKFSIPEWMSSRFENNFGIKQSREIFKIVARPPLLSIRVRGDDSDFLAFMTLLDKEAIPYKQIYDSQWILIEDKEKFWKKDYIASKMCTVQDYSSGIACRLFDFESFTEPHVLDICAAPGGKSIQILDQLKGRGYLIANDIDETRTKMLKDNLKLVNYQNYQISNRDGNHLEGNFTHILLDAPCTGLGTLRKRADLRWNRTPGDFEKMNNIQLDLLQRAGNLLKEGGEIIYSTCSIDPSENQSVIEQFLGSNKNFQIVELHIAELNKYKTAEFGYLLLPDELHDGSFAIKLIKSGPNK